MVQHFITSELTEEIYHMRRRYRLRMWITLGVLMITIWLVLKIFNILPTYQIQLLNRDRIFDNQLTKSRALERLQQSHEYQNKADINKINKLNDIADV